MDAQQQDIIGAWRVIIMVGTIPRDFDKIQACPEIGLQIDLGTVLACNPDDPATPITAGRAAGHQNCDDCPRPTHDPGPAASVLAARTGADNVSDDRPIGIDMSNVRPPQGPQQPSDQPAQPPRAQPPPPQYGYGQPQQPRYEQRPPQYVQQPPYVQQPRYTQQPQYAPDPRHAQQPMPPQNFQQFPGAPPESPKKKGGVLRIAAFIVLGVVALLLLVNILGGGRDKDPDQAVPAGTQSTQTEATEQAPPPEPKPTTAAVPTEYKSALKKAQSYVDMMAFSEARLYDQLTSEYGEKFSHEAAQYAIENVQVDWYAEALESAITYQEMMSMSPAAIWDQLTSEYGEAFTPDQADYAIANLPA